MKPGPGRINETAAVGFERGAADYERGRPGYPPAVVRRLGPELAIEPGQTIIDLAAGTGKLTRELTALGAELIAIEPVAGMRAQLQRVVGSVRILDGTAESMPVGDGVASAVFVAQAFHWFRMPEAATEIARVLRPRGALVIIRNRWDEHGPDWMPALRELIATRVQRTPTDDADWQAQLDQTGLFEPMREWTEPNPVTGDIDTLRDRIASMSYIAALDDGVREQLLDDVTSLLRDHGLLTHQRLQIPTVTNVRWARKRA